MSVDISLHRVKLVETTEPNKLFKSPDLESDNTYVMDVVITHEGYEGEEEMKITLFSTKEQLNVITGVPR
jgi:hypothetical protein